MTDWSWNDDAALWQMKYDNLRAASAEAYLRARLAGHSQWEANAVATQEVPA
jgi:hypothetical protein